MVAFQVPIKCPKCKKWVWELEFVMKKGNKYIHWCRECKKDWLKKKRMREKNS